MSLRKDTKRKTVKTDSPPGRDYVLVCARNSKKNGTLEDYIEFLSASNAFANHRRKPFQKITGRSFKI